MVRLSDTVLFVVDVHYLLNENKFYIIVTKGIENIYGT